MTTYERPFGRYFEDFEPGDVYKHWPGKTITEYDDHLFCMITMNHHPLHTDAWYAETQTQFGRNVVVGNLVYSLVLGMSVPDVSGARDREPRGRGAQAQDADVPRRHDLRGDEGAREAESSSRPDRGVVTVETRGYNQRGEEVCYFRRKVMVRKRDAAPPRGAARTRRPSSGSPTCPASGEAVAADPGCLFCRIVAGRGRGDDRRRRPSTPSRSSTTARCSRATRSSCRAPTSATLRDLPADLSGPSSPRCSGSPVAVQDVLGADGSFVAANNVVSQSVPHLHVHVVPRRRKDGLRGFFWPRTRYPDSDRMEEVAAAVRAALQSAANGVIL